MPAGKDVRKSLDDRLIVGRQRFAGRVERPRPVGIQLDESDREELHELARVVFVGTDVTHRVRLLVAEHVEKPAHRRVQRHVLEQLAVVAKGAASEQVVVIRSRERHVHERTVLGDDQDLREREGDALTQLVGRPHCEPVKRVLPLSLQHPGTLDHRVPGLHGGQLQRRPERQLFVDPALVGIARVTQRDQPIDLGSRRPERGLAQEAERFGARERLRGGDLSARGECDHQDDARQRQTKSLLHRDSARLQSLIRTSGGGSSVCRARNVRGDGARRQDITRDHEALGSAFPGM